jgi:hypothetical protein
MQWLHQLPRYWQTTSIITYVLWPIEVLYKLAWSVRRTLFAWGFIQTHKLHATVIVVGNVVAGGGGKTPLTMAIVQRLTQQGHQVGVVSRGYGRSQDQVKMAEIQQKNIDAQLDATNRKRDRESRERLAAVKLAEEMAMNPQGLGIVQQIIDPGMLQRLEGNEQPMTPTPGGVIK